MGKRSYRQFCPLAYSLDVIGERWTLLIVRELRFGPRRYTDLLSGLPGIGTNLLAKRLKEMEREGIILQRTLPPPASSTVYELTERGRGLEEVVLALAKWGATYLQGSKLAEHFLGTVQGMTALELCFVPASAAGMSVTCEIHAGQDVFYASVQDGVLDVVPGPAAHPNLVIRGSVKAILQRMIGAPTPNGTVVIEAGDAALFGQFAAAFRFPVS